MTAYLGYRIVKDRGAASTTAGTGLLELSGSSGDANRTYTLSADDALDVINILKQGVSLTYTTHYTVSSGIVTFLVSVDDGEIIEINYTAGSEESGFSGVTYCTPTDVKRILQVKAFSTTTTPTEAEVSLTINRFEDYIDQITHHGWREKTVTDEIYDIPTIPYNYSTGMPIHLKHRKIRDFDTAEGDKLEVWNGSSWEDWLTSRTEGRNADYWIDPEQGTLFLRNPLAYHKTKSVRLTYRYGESTIPKDIRDACALLTAAELLESDDRSMMVNETGDSTRVSYDIRISNFKKRAEKLIENHKEFYVW